MTARAASSPESGSTCSKSTDEPLLACVILAHADPAHLGRLVAALDPFPVFVHVDSSTSDEVFREMTEQLPARCVILPRIATGWAKWENVEAELEGYRAALAATNATHIALMTGSDYPLAAAEAITARLAGARGTTFAMIHELPHPYWGQNHGFSRLRYRHWAWRKRMIRLPIPRRLPRGIVFAGGSQLKVLSREHAQIVVEAADSRPDLVSFWRRSWVADETFVPSILSTPAFTPGWVGEHEQTNFWWISWGVRQHKSPPWLDESYRDDLLNQHGAGGENFRYLFARKFSSEVSGPLLDAIDARISIPSSTPGEREVSR